MDPKLKHYSVAYLNERLTISVFDVWLPDDLNQETALCAALAEHLGIDGDDLSDVYDTVRSLNLFDSAVMSEITARPTDNVVFRAPMKRWEAYEGTDPWPQEPEYEVVVSHTQGALSVDLHPTGDDPDASPAPPRLGVGFEINCGVPCMHLYAGPAGEVAQSVFGMPEDRLATRQGDSCEWISHHGQDFTIKQAHPEHRRAAQHRADSP